MESGMVLAIVWQVLRKFSSFLIDTVQLADGGQVAHGYPTCWCSHLQISQLHRIDLV